MGICLSSSFSSKSELSASPSAKVVSANGELHEYNLPIFVSQVLQAETTSSSSYFLCNSDLLAYDDCIPVMDSNSLLQANQIYFLLPKSKLKQRLTAPDMAALAVKASVALQKFASKKHAIHRNKARIAPVLLVNTNIINTSFVIKSFDQNEKPKQQPSAATVKKLQKYTPKQAKFSAHSFEIKLSTIYEGTTS